MRTLDFAPDNKQHFEIIYDGIIGSARGFDGKNEARVIGRVLDKLEGIGETTQRGGMTTYRLRESGGTVELEDAEFELMYDAISHVKWSARFARQVAQTFEWLDASSREPKA